MLKNSSTNLKLVLLQCADGMEHNTVGDASHPTSVLFCKQCYKQYIAGAVVAESSIDHKDYGGDAC